MFEYGKKGARIGERGEVEGDNRIGKRLAGWQEYVDKIVMRVTVGLPEEWRAMAGKWRGPLRG